MILVMFINVSIVGISSAEDIKPEVIYKLGESLEEEEPVESSEPTETEEDESDLFRTLSTTVQIDPGEMFYIYFDPEDNEIAARPPEDLPDECDLALEMVPDWLKGNLSYKFRRLSSDFQTIYANLIINSPEERFIDEIAFVIAHTAVENLQDDYFFPELITHNAQLIYDADQYLKYVQIVERGDYTTVIYKDKDNISVELEKDIYYWFIVEPKLSDELATYVDPDYNFVYDPPFDRNYGVPPPTGKFWRDWLFYHNDSGYPLLKDYLDDAYTLWEAISRCNNWMSGSMSFTSDEERPIQPVRIYRKHIGRCGEYQDMRNAIARAGLIPSTCTINSAEDHVWNEFWDKRWIHWDGTVDNPMMYENGWGKDISSVWNTKGDSDIWSVTSKYTPVCYYTATVLDASGLPVDGAHIDVQTEFYYNDSLLTLTTWGSSDYTGKVTIPLGDERNYWSSAETDDLGSDPLNGVTQVIENSSAGTEYTHTFNLPLSAEALKVSDVIPPPVVDPKYRMNISFEVDANIMSVENSYTGEHGDLYAPSGNIDFFIADDLNYNLYINDLSFSAYRVLKRITSEDLAYLFWNEDRHYVVLSNEFSQETTKIVNIRVDIYSAISVDITSPGNGSEFNQGDTVVISGWSQSPIGVTSVRINIDNQGSWYYAVDTSSAEQDPYTTWEYYWYTSSYKPGLHIITAMATDSENTTTDSITINLNDVTIPYIEIKVPGEGAILWLGDSFFLNGTARDNGWIDVLMLIIDSDVENSIDLIPYLVGDTFSYELNANGIGYGDHELTVWVNDTASNYNSDTVNIRIQEVVPPQVGIDLPQAASIFKPGDIIYISGSASDNMELLTLEIIVDSEDPIDITSELDENGLWLYDWETESTLSDGEHDIMVRATDASSNVAIDTVTVIFDGTSPEITIESPSEGSVWWSGENLNIWGTAIDGTGVQNLELIIDLDDANAVDLLPLLLDDTWEYKISTDDLDYGDHSITVWTDDIMSNYDSMDRNFRILETVEPDVRIDMPLDNSIFKPGDSIDIYGVATDNWEIVSLEVIIDDSSPISIISSMMEDGLWYYNWSTDTSTTVGEHIIEVRATDVSGNVASDEVTIFLDGTAPEADILNPMGYQIFKVGDYITFQGTASDDLELTKVELIFDNDVKVDITNKVTNGNWEYTYTDTNDLESGEHIVIVSATDSVGHNYKSSLIIRLDVQKPDVEFTPIEEDSIKIGEAILIKGFAWDDIEVKELVLITDENDQINLTSNPSNGYWEYHWDTYSLS
ncbi:MAG: hypothetical protein JSV09_10585, partial [Thermoplasmata archaeon]